MHDVRGGHRHGNPEDTVGGIRPVIEDQFTNLRRHNA
jgi:hypothetical protein